MTPSMGPDLLRFVPYSERIATEGEDAEARVDTLLAEIPALGHFWGWVVVRQLEAPLGHRLFVEATRGVLQADRSSQDLPSLTGWQRSIISCVLTAL